MPDITVISEVDSFLAAANQAAMRSALGLGGLNIGFSKDGGGSALTASTLATAITIPYAATITGYSLSADTGTFTVKFWKIANGTAIPTIANVINTSGLSLSSGTHVRSSTTSDFTTLAIAAGDIIMCAITAVSGATWITAQIEII